jgi:hypothetical protein
VEVLAATANQMAKIMPKKLLLIVVFVALVVASAYLLIRTRHPNFDLDKFASFDELHGPTNGWQGPIFELSQDYPRVSPAPEEYRWEKINFTTDARGYLAEVLRYVYEGNIEVDWVVQKNPTRRWFHAPWMHAAEIKPDKDQQRCRDEKGREFIHGLTRERSTSLAELNFNNDPDRKDCANVIENWAVSVFNAPGGFVIRQVWEETTVKGRLPKPENFPKDFPEGTVVTKLLFTAATPAQVPYLAGSPEWRADINRGVAPVTLRLLQVDVAVRDRRADRDGQDNEKKASGWVFGTLAYDKDAPPLFEDGKDVTLPWRRLNPIGLMYGNELSQTVLVDDKIKQTQHLGCQERLAGPVDNLSSSCLACHNLAEVNDGDKPLSSIKYARNKYDQCRCLDDVKFWFKTLYPGKPFTQGAISLNFSLQLSNGILRYCQHHPESCPPDPNRPSAEQESSLKTCPSPTPSICPVKQTGASLSCSPTPSPASTPALSNLGSSSIPFSAETSRGGDVEETVANPKSKKSTRKKEK